ncbi:MAG: efflux RND transporter periplasmic adaptor subunit [Treponema sp.]|nr:efflux RND transporter periplasmic adaptor subunit [Treponema sp.]
MVSPVEKHAISPRTALFCLVLAALLLAGCDGRNQAVNYELTAVRRGTLERTVMSSGTIHPVSTVRVLPLMSGKVERIFVDYNDTVRRGDILAELNTDMLRLRREQMQAAVIRARANYELQALNYRNQAVLFERDLISEFELLTSRTTVNNLAADLAVAEANLRVTETEIYQHAFIVSPIDGIVLARNINIGDTVTDSTNANTSPIFTLAENLREMQIEAMVSELDVASIHRGQPVRFSLESMPGRSFGGEVETLRLIPTVTNNVVSFTVIIRVENRDGSLLPGMTCLVEFIVERSEDVLMVSNAALRYQPTNLSDDRIADMIFGASIRDLDDEQRQMAIEAREQARQQATAQARSGGQGANTVTNLMMAGNPGAGRMMMTGGGGGRRPAGGGQGGRNPNAVVMRHLWYLNGDGTLGVMRVQTGISNGSFTEIITPNDMEGMQFILRERV